MVEDAWDRGVVLHQEGRLAEAAVAYRQAVDDGDEDAWLGVAAVALQRGCDDEADEALAALLGSGDDGLAGWAGELLGCRRWWLHGDAEGARTALRVAVARGDDDLVRSAAGVLGDLEAALGRRTDALAAYAVFTRGMRDRWNAELGDAMLERLARGRLAQWRRPRTRAAGMRVRRWRERRRTARFARGWSPPPEWSER